MNRCLAILVVVSALLVMNGCTMGPTMPSDAEQVLRDGSDFELLSLDPHPEREPSGDRFHGVSVLGSTAITDADTRGELRNAFHAGVADHDGLVALCFDPRHGIQVVHEGKTHAFVICFECSQVEWYVDGKRQDGFLISASPQPTFDKVLKEASVPLAEKPGE